MHTFHPSQIIPRASGLLALLSGALLTLSFPGSGHYAMAWFALIPLVLAMADASPRKAARLGLYCGLAHGLSLYYWIAPTIHTYGGLPMFQAIPIMTLLAFYTGLYPMAAAYVSARHSGDIRGMMLILPTAWTASEWLRAHLFTGFPWALLGYSQYDNPLMIQIADITGVYGVSAFIVFTNAALAVCVLHLLKIPWQARRIDRFSMYLCLFALLVAVISVAGYGQKRMTEIEAAQTSAPVFRASVIQGNIDQSLKWDPEFQEETIKRYARMSLKAEKENPDLIVWPETATPFYFPGTPDLSDIVIQCARVTGVPILFGSPSYTVENGRVLYHNTAYTLNAMGYITGSYNKFHLVPFGEYIPLKQIFPFLGKMVGQIADFTPGDPGRTLTAGHATLGPQICYEIIFPELSRRMVKNGADILVNITNDAWFGTTGAPYQHFAMAVFRAVEYRRAVVRCANTGFSGHILPSGKIISRTRLFHTETETKGIPLLKSETIYLRYGDLFALCCMGCVLFLELFPLLPGRKQKFQKPEHD